MMVHGPGAGSLRMNHSISSEYVDFKISNTINMYV